MDLHRRPRAMLQASSAPTTQSVSFVSMQAMMKTATPNELLQSIQPTCELGQCSLFLPVGDAHRHVWPRASSHLVVYSHLSSGVTTNRTSKVPRHVCRHCVWLFSLISAIGKLRGWPGPWVPRKACVEVLSHLILPRGPSSTIIMEQQHCCEAGRSRPQRRPLLARRYRVVWRITYRVSRIVHRRVGKQVRGFGDLGGF
jgi:hypothetical protein